MTEQEAFQKISVLRAVISEQVWDTPNTVSNVLWYLDQAIDQVNPSRNMEERAKVED